MRKEYCPSCDSNKVFHGEDWVFIILGALAMTGGLIALLLSFPGAYNGDWTVFAPLAQENPFAPMVIIFGLLMFISGVKDWHLLVCGTCGYKWHPRRRPQLHPFN
jgi:hypothetical protein